MAAWQWQCRSDAPLSFIDLPCVFMRRRGVYNSEEAHVHAASLTIRSGNWHTCYDLDASLKIRSGKRHTCNDASQDPRSVVKYSKWRLKRDEAREEASGVNVRQRPTRKPQTTSSVPRFSCCSYRSSFSCVPPAAATRKIFCVCCVCFVSPHPFTLTTPRYHRGYCCSVQVILD